MKKFSAWILLIVVITLTSCVTRDVNVSVDTDVTYTSYTYDVLNNNIPQFTKKEITTTAFESYSEMDDLGRCGVALACIGEELMPTEERGSIGQIKPSGWQMTKYDIVDGKYLYNRCHLIGYQLAGENANEKNLITGTRYMNVEGMLPFENMVADYVQETKNHVMYRVTPVFEGQNLLAKGVQMEAYSVEDDGKGISFNVFVNNVQPGVLINYFDGTSELEKSEDTTNNEEQQIIIDQENDEQNLDNETKSDYVLNTNTMKFHLPECPSVEDIKPKNKKIFNGTKLWLIDNGYFPCQRCNP